MKIQTLSLVVQAGCGAGCPFCIARQTLGMRPPEVPRLGLARRNLLKALSLAELGKCTTALITSKGEPLNNPDAVEGYIRQVYDSSIPIVELQTNGLAFQRRDYSQLMEAWRGLGLTTVAISCVGVDDKKNQEIYDPNRAGKYCLEAAVGTVLDAGLMCRLTVVMFAGGVDNVDAVGSVIDYCKVRGIQQVTFGPVAYPEGSRDSKVLAWASEHVVGGSAFADIISTITASGTPILSLMHDAKVWDVGGVSVCLRNCLTTSREPEEIRSLIYWPDGRVTYDWNLKGARLL